MARRTVAVLVLAALAGGRPAAAGAEEKPAADARQARAEAIRQTLEVINQELKDHGGSFEKWGEALKDFREDIQKVKTTVKWPWPAKDGFVFQGRALDLLARDTLDKEPDGKRPYDCIVEFDKELKAKGIDLIFVPLPDKVSIYPDFLFAAPVEGQAGDVQPARCPEDRMVSLAAKHLLKKLLESDVEVVNLYTYFRDVRNKEGDEKPFYYDKDSHWRNRAAQMAGEKIAERLKRYDFVQKALAGGNRYTVKPELRTDGKADDLLTVLDSNTRGYYADAPGSPIVLTGCSNAMLNMTGKIAHLPAQAGRHIGLPLAFCPNIFGDVPGKLKGRLNGRRVIVWTLVARYLVGDWPMGGALVPRAKK